METVDFTKGSGTVISTFSTESIEEYPQKYIVEIADDNSISIICRVDINRVLYKFVGFANIKFAGVAVSNRADLESKIDEYFYKVSSGGTGGGSGTSASNVEDRQLEALIYMGSNIKAQCVANVTSTATGLSSGRMYFSPVWLYKAEIITGIHLLSGLSDSNITPTANENKLGLYSYNKNTGVLTLVGQTANNPGIYQHLGEEHFQTPLVTPYSAAAGLLFVAFLSNFSAGTNSMSLTQQFYNTPASGKIPSTYLLPNFGKIFFTYGTGVTVLPTSLTMEQCAAATQTIWSALY